MMNQRKVLFYAGDGGSGGYLRYCHGLLCSDAIPDWCDVHVVCSPRMHERLRDADRKVSFHVDNKIGTASIVKRTHWHFWGYPALAARIKADIEFYPIGYLPHVRRRVPTVVTCHNLLPFDEREIARYGNSAQRRSVRALRRKQASSFSATSGRIYPSRYSRDVIGSQIAGCAIETVIGHGVDSWYFQSTPRIHKAASPARLVYVSDIHPYKNHAHVFEAIAKLRTNRGIDVHLDVAGKGTVSEMKRLQGVMGELKLDKYVHLLGSLNSEALKSLYDRSLIVVFASSLETFGIALGEAMASRMPIACSERSGLQELLGDGGLYFEPTCSDSIAHALDLLIGSEDLRNTVAERAYQRACAFNWKQRATETFAFLENVLVRSNANGHVAKFHRGPQALAQAQ